MKALVNSNPLVSAILNPKGPSGQIFQRWRRGEFELAVSPTTLAELMEVLHRPHIVKKYSLQEETIQSHRRPVFDFAEVAAGALSVEAVRDDPDDNHVLAAAVETQAEYIVSGDQHLLQMGAYHGIRILSPREFLRLLDTADEAGETVKH